MTRQPVLLVLAVLVLAAAPVRAQWAVVDVQAIAQLLREVQTMQQQLLVAQTQLTQARTALATMTGQRGMQSLLSGVERNYLPTTAPQLFAAVPGGGGYPIFAQDVRTAMTTNAVLSTSQVSTLAPADQSRLLAVRQANAVRTSIAEEALANSSGRFAEIQSLIGAIGRADDQKSILELQARIVAELGMLQGEQNKLLTLTHALEAQDAVNALKERETVLAGQGQFATRLRPTP